MGNYKVKIPTEAGEVETLADILPENGAPLRVLFIAKTPAPVSVAAGHYFQGRQGKAFWNKLAEYSILKVPEGEFEDDHLLENEYGITDVVKVPRAYGNEPCDKEYRSGSEHIMNLIKTHSPKVLFFVYKRVLYQILELGFDIKEKSSYGFNPHLESEFGAKVFVFPMPGTPCRKETARQFMVELQLFLEG